MDQCGYDYGARGTYGNQSSPVQVPCELRGQIDPPLPSERPPVGSRVGVDLHPLDVRRDDDASWLEALVWPEHDQRRTLVANAIEVSRDQDSRPELRAGDALEELASVVDEVPAEQAICLYNTYVLYQFSDAQRERLYDLVTDLGESRDVYWL